MKCANHARQKFILDTGISLTTTSFCFIDSILKEGLTRKKNFVKTVSNKFKEGLKKEQESAENLCEFLVAQTRTFNPVAK